MEDKQKIIFMYRTEGRSLREIAKVLNLHRATVTKIVREVDSIQQSENPPAALDDNLATFIGKSIVVHRLTDKFILSSHKPGQH